MYRRGKKGTWYISVGGIGQTSGTTNRQLAKQIEQKLNTEALQLTHGIVIPDWDKACLRWFAEHPGASAKDTQIAAWWKRFLTGKKLTTIDGVLVNEILTRERPGIDPKNEVKQNSTANTYVMFVGKVIRNGSNLRPKFIKYPAIAGTERWVRPEEWLAISAHLSTDVRDILTFSLATGLREENVMEYQWAWDLGISGLIPKGDYKTRTTHGFPYNRTAQEVLERRRRATVKHMTLVFTNEGKPFYQHALLRPLARACKIVGIPNVTVHALRHTFGTWLAMGMVPKDIRQRLMGHAGADVHDNYIHWDVENLRSYSEVIDTTLRAAVSKVGQRAG